MACFDIQISCREAAWVKGEGWEFTQEEEEGSDETRASNDYCSR